jgi:hypothetical protein
MMEMNKKELEKIYFEIIKLYKFDDPEGGFEAIYPKDLNKIFIKHGLDKKLCRRENDFVWVKEFKK